MVSLSQGQIDATVMSRWLGRATLIVAAAGLIAWIAALGSPKADYVGTGLLLAPTNYGLILPLLGFGAATAELDALLLIETLALFVAGLAVSASVSEGLLLAHQDVLSFIVRYPITNCVLALLSGLALLTGPRLKGIPIATAALLLGIAFGITIGLYSPGDDEARWFVAPAAIAGVALVLLGAYIACRIQSGAWWRIARSILGSWLVAAGVLLAGFPLVPKKPEPPQSTSSENPEMNNVNGPSAVEVPSQAPPPPGFDTSHEP